MNQEPPRRRPSLFIPPLGGYSFARPNMPRVLLETSTDVPRSPRVLQVEGMFDLHASREVATEYVEVPWEERDWHVGFVVGPSGSGKTTLCRRLLGLAGEEVMEWRGDRALIDEFPDRLGIRRITSLLCAAGLNAPRCWLRPYSTLSGGEQFRARVARLLAQPGDPLFIDEFTSTLDRTVARHASCSLARMVRAENRQLVVAGCHEDVMEWLQPDWVYEAGGRGFYWRSVRRRPDIVLRVRRVVPGAWRIFRRHHYLSADLHPGAQCFVSYVEGAAAAFTAVIPFPHPHRPGWREHRTVCRPDFQGLGMGHAHAEFVASLFRATGRPYFCATSNPAMIRHRAKSPHWRMLRPPSLAGTPNLKSMRKRASLTRWTASFEYVGAPRFRDAGAFGLKAPVSPF